MGILDDAEQIRRDREDSESKIRKLRESPFADSNLWSSVYVVFPFRDLGEKAESLLSEVLEAFRTKLAPLRATLVVGPSWPGGRLLAAYNYRHVPSRSGPFRDHYYSRADWKMIIKQWEEREAKDETVFSPS